MLSRFFFSLSVLLLLAAAPVASATSVPSTAASSSTVGTTGNPIASVGLFGTDAFTSFGETFLSPGGTLTSVTFSSINVYTGLNARLVIAPISGTTTGDSLYSSQYSLTDGSNTFGNLGVSTTAGAEYFAYLTTDGVRSNPVGLASFGSFIWNNYADGAFLYGGTDCNPNTFRKDFLTSDLAFSATFAPAAVAVTPEPSSLVLLSTGLLSAGSMLRRRRSVVA